MTRRRRKSRNRGAGSPSGAWQAQDRRILAPDGGVAQPRLAPETPPAQSPYSDAFLLPQFRRHHEAPAWWARPATYVIGGAVLLVLGWLLRPVLTTVLSAFAVAYFVSPLVDRLERRRIPRSVSIAAIIGGFFAILAGLVAFLVPVIQSEIQALVANAPGYWERGNAFFNETVRPEVLERTGYEIPTTARDVWNQAGTRLTGMAPDIAGRLADVLKATVSNVFGLLAVVLNLLLFPIFLFYLLQDFPRIKKAIADAVPPRLRPELGARLTEVDTVLSAFVRGQLTVCIVLAVFYSLGLVLTGIDLAVVIGVVSGLAFVIPYAGTVLGIVVASVMAIVKFGALEPSVDFFCPNYHLLGVWATFGIVQFFESNIITPRIVGSQVGLHPVVMITAVIVGGTLFGFLGILLAVPATAVGAVFWRAALERYKRSEFYVARR